MKKINCIMLIDDNEDDNFFHNVVVQEMDVAHKIKITESGFEALDYLANENTPPELIFLDINMPKMNGWEFLEEYVKLKVQHKAKVVIIMLTTSLNPSDKEKAQAISAISGFETKPLTAEIITRVMDNHFQGVQ